MKPHLPSELEREIFELAAARNRRSIPKLLLVARRVHEWLEPLLYHVLLFRRDRDDKGPTKPMPMEPIMRAIETKPRAFFYESVKHLAVNNNVPRANVERILSVCTGIVNLALFNGDSDPSFIPYIDCIRPQRFAANMMVLFAGAPDFTHSLFANVTHLDIADTFGLTWEPWNKLALLPCLTHLSFNYSDEALPAGLFHTVLVECALLQALVVVWPNMIMVEYEAEFSQYPTHDPRFVMIICSKYFWDWEAGARGGVDFWSRADTFIAQKRLGAVSQDVCLLDDTPIDRFY
ncbi:hypothetical protein B0H11DRAFT_507179 [Mycena galericulata]|nr:hypothetical protein B0H11DRAFT_507179 [Mycena galericulata]